MRLEVKIREDLKKEQDPKPQKAVPKNDKNSYQAHLKT